MIGARSGDKGGDANLGVWARDDAGYGWLAGWLTVAEQRWIVGQFRAWERGPVPLRSAKVRGHEMSVRTVCLGWHWQPYKYTREATDAADDGGDPVVSAGLGQR